MKFKFPSFSLKIHHQKLAKNHKTSHHLRSLAISMGKKFSDPNEFFIAFCLLSLGEKAEKSHFVIRELQIPSGVFHEIYFQME